MKPIFSPGQQSSAPRGTQQCLWWRSALGKGRCGSRREERTTGVAHLKDRLTLAQEMEGGSAPCSVSVTPAFPAHVAVLCNGHLNHSQTEELRVTTPERVTQLHRGNHFYVSLVLLNGDGLLPGVPASAAGRTTCVPCSQAT